MHVLAACDKFRGTATAPQVTAAIVEAAEVLGATGTALAMADGGEGMLEAFGGANRTASVDDALGRPILAGWRQDGRRAVIESAAANGLHQVGGITGNDPLAASTDGVGQLIAAALHAGVDTLIIGVGGSASTDGGMGAIAALDRLQMLDAFRAADVTIACDVTTPFTAAATVFGPQKGADESQRNYLRSRLHSARAELLSRFGVDVEGTTGSGAAGGLSGGLAAVGATLCRGVDIVARHVGLDDALERADIVVTGEGCLDETSLQGKVVGAVVARAQAAGRPVAVICGSRSAGVDLPGVVVRDLVSAVGQKRALRETKPAVRTVAIEVLRGLMATDQRRARESSR